MTQDEMNAEFGALLRERAALKTKLACLKSKLLKARTAFGTAAAAIKNNAEWPLEDSTESGLLVPNLTQDWTRDRCFLPPLDDFERWLREKKAAEVRIAEINEILPD